MIFRSAPAWRTPLARLLLVAVLAVPLGACGSTSLGSLFGAEELAAAPGKLADWMGECRDLLDTAALMRQLDLVITVDTVVAHLAGALGLPVWMFNRYESEWRWMLAREDSPWYPTLRLYRQERPGDWDAPIARAAAALREFSRAR